MKEYDISDEEKGCKEAIEYIKHTHNDIKEIWDYGNSGFEIHIPKDGKGVWQSDVKEGYKIQNVDIRENNDSVVRIVKE